MSVTLQMSIFTQLAQSKFVEATISEIYKHKQASRGIWALKAGHKLICCNRLELPCEPVTNYQAGDIYQLFVQYCLHEEIANRDERR